MAAFAPHAAWTSSATHAVLPLLATGGRRAAAARGRDRVAPPALRRRGRGGLWLPECGHASWLDPLLEEAGVHAVCVDLTDPLGRGDGAQLRPLRSGAGPLLVPIDRALIDLVWHHDGYPSAGAYRNTRRYTEHRHTPWAVDGVALRPRARGRAGPRARARRSPRRPRARLADGGLAVCALDTELLGHFWHEGVDWLAAVIEACDAAGRRAARARRARCAEAETAPAPAELPVTSWGEPRDLATWSAPPAADLAWRAREAELRVFGAGGAASGARALRELLALQASDWAFGVTRETAGPYSQRARRRARRRARAARSPIRPESGPRLRNLAPSLDLSNPRLEG